MPGLIEVTRPPRSPNVCEESRRPCKIGVSDVTALATNQAQVYTIAVDSCIETRVVRPDLTIIGAGDRQTTALQTVMLKLTTREAAWQGMYKHRCLTPTWFNMLRPVGTRCWEYIGEIDRKTLSTYL
jgi:hypothetical protein